MTRSPWWTACLWIPVPPMFKRMERTVMLQAQPPLSREEFGRRRQELRAAGKELTMENIHPEFVAWIRRRQRVIAVQMVVLILTVLAIFVIAALTSIR